MEGADNGVAALGVRAAELASALPTVVAARLPFEQLEKLTGMELSVPQQERLAAEAAGKDLSFAGQTKESANAGIAAANALFNR